MQYSRYLRAGIAAFLLAGVAVAADKPSKPGKWMSGDFHQHTLFTDGSHPMIHLVSAGFDAGLDWMANSEHGGARPQDGAGLPWDDPAAYPVNPIVGDKATANYNGTPHQVMWRWQSVRDYSFPMVQTMRSYWPYQLFAQGLEWNMPGHEHCSTGIVAKDAAGIAQFEYLFDASDKDISGGAAQGWSGKITVNDHAKAVLGAQWMQKNYPDTSWIVPAHPERAASYKIEHFRDLNNAAPTVAFGFEGMPGHQKETPRGSYTANAVGGGTYGGAGVFIAKVGGLWDALLGEGRHWWTFVSSDFHNMDNDYWPGEYARTWTYVTDDNQDGTYSLEEVVNGLRSGNSFSVHGGLIDALDFTANGRTTSATMGQQLTVRKGSRVTLRIRFRSPRVNTNGDAPSVDHIDIISGAVNGKIAPDSPDYKVDTNPTTKVLATLSSSEWQQDDDGWITVEYTVNSVKKGMYFRLRGTNLAPNTPYETDAVGNPLPDTLVAENLKLSPAEIAWRDLWFYSNPIFVAVE